MTAYDTKPSAGSYTRDGEIDALLTWDQTEETWVSTEWTWNEQIGDITRDSKPSVWVGAVIPEGIIESTFIIRGDDEAIYIYDEEAS
jgi:hypothetical protein